MSLNRGREVKSYHANTVRWAARSRRDGVTFFSHSGPPVPLLLFPPPHGMSKGGKRHPLTPRFFFFFLSLSFAQPYKPQCWLGYMSVSDHYGDEIRGMEAEVVFASFRLIGIIFSSSNFSLENGTSV